MLIHDKKAAVTLMMSRKSPKGEKLSGPTPVKPEISQTEPGEVDGRHTAMQDFMAGHHEGSAEKMAQAMSNFIDLHKSMTETPDKE